jgi:hypothetical protein
MPAKGWGCMKRLGETSGLWAWTAIFSAKHRGSDLDWDIFSEPQLPLPLQRGDWRAIWIRYLRV